MPSMSHTIGRFNASTSVLRINYIKKKVVDMIAMLKHHGNVHLMQTMIKKGIGSLLTVGPVVHQTAYRNVISQRAFSTDDPAITEQSVKSDTGPNPSKVVVFGGSGYVGSRVCEQATMMGAQVISISRHGRPSWLASSGSPAWADAVQWEIGDALDSKQTWRDLLNGCAGVVSTLGAFGSNEFMYRICGTANITVIDAARDAKVPRFAFISVHDYAFPAGWHAQDYLLKGYFQGKRDVEAHLSEVYPNSGVALRPGFIYGSRAVGNTKIPLGLVGAPLAAALNFFPTTKLARVPIIGAVFVPPVSVNSVGKAAASAVLDSTVPPGPMDVWTIASKYST